MGRGHERLISNAGTCTFHQIWWNASVPHLQRTFTFHQFGGMPWFHSTSFPNQTQGWMLDAEPFHSILIDDPNQTHSTSFEVAVRIYIVTLVFLIYDLQWLPIIIYSYLSSSPSICKKTRKESSKQYIHRNIHN
jgi:hypothetical protein